MKVSLIFNLPDEKEDFDDALNGVKWHCIYEELFVWIRKETKHTDRETLTFDELKEKLIEIRDEFFE